YAGEPGSTCVSSHTASTSPFPRDTGRSVLGRLQSDASAWIAEHSTVEIEEVVGAKGDPFRHVSEKLTLGRNWIQPGELLLAGCRSVRRPDPRHRAPAISSGGGNGCCRAQESAETLQG